MVQAETWPAFEDITQDELKTPTTKQRYGDGRIYRLVGLAR